jgi:hypothetical protein
MDFSWENLQKISKGIARIRQKNVVGIDEADSAVEYFTRLDNFHKQNHNDGVVMDECQNCRRDRPRDLMYKYDAQPRSKLYGEYVQIA